MISSRTRWVALALLLVCPPLVARPQMVADLYSGKAGLGVGPSLLGIYFVHDGASYFFAADAQQGDELWRTDGTAVGTYRLTDICPGACDSGVSILGFFNGRIYLTANDGEHGDALWRTDEKPGHEELVQGVCEGACLAGLERSQTWRNALWFLIPPAYASSELWTSDLTASGTHAVANLCTDLGICEKNVMSLGGPDPSGQGLLLWAYTNSRANPLLLLRTDGTPQGTVLLHRFQGFSGAPSWPNPAPFFPTPAVGSPLFFNDGSDLWTSDGTPAGTHFVRSLDGLVSSLDNFVVQSQEVVDGVWYGMSELTGEWLRSDGTAAGTVVLGNFFFPTVTHVGSAVLAITDEGVWRAGTTAATTVKVFDWKTDGILGVVEQADRAFVVHSNGTLWTTDGTAAGTRHVRLPAGPPVDQYSMTGLGGGVVMSRGGDQLWRVDATATRVAQLHDFQPANGPALSQSGVVLDDRLLFYARSGLTTSSLFASDGTGARTTVITSTADEEFFPLDEHLFTRFGGNKILFDSSVGLRVTDGSARGTRRLGRNHNDYRFPYLYSPVATVGDELVFAGQTPPAGCYPGKNEPWVTDGLPRHTHEIVDLNPYFYPGGGSQCADGVPFSSHPGLGISLGSIALFAADDLVHGRELFATDGTAAGTRLVADINPTTVPNTVTEPPGVPLQVGVGSNPSDFVLLGSRVVFVADDGSTGRQLWITNGTKRGTRRVVGRAAGREGSMPHDLVIWRGAVYFIALHGNGEGLFRSDGTARGTVLVSGLELADQASLAKQLMPVRNRLFFAAFNESTGTELWTSQGTPQTTHMVADLRPGVRGSAPQSFAAVHGVLVFAADDGVTGLEPWRSDGTAAGTFSLGDLASGDASSNPGPFWEVGDRVLFGADDGEHGRQLWAVPIADVVDPSRSPFLQPPG